MAFQQYLSSLEFNTKNAGLADHIQAQGQQGRAGISDASNDDWVGINGVLIPAPALRADPATPRQPSSRPKTASTRPSMIVPGNYAPSEYKYDEGAKEMVWVGRP